MVTLNYLLSRLHQICFCYFPLYQSVCAFISVFSLLSIPLTLNRFVEPDPSHTLEERVVHWYFAQLDNNGSHDINKKELKPFKRYLKKKAKPKKCARKFTDYCDLNKDRAISLQELKGCLGVSKEGKRTRKAGKKTEWEETRWLGVDCQGHTVGSWPWYEPQASCENLHTESCLLQQLVRDALWHAQLIFYGLTATSTKMKQMKSLQKCKKIQGFMKIQDALVLKSNFLWVFIYTSVQVLTTKQNHFHLYPN